MWALANPDKVQQTAESVAESLSGAAPGSLGSTVVGPFGTIARNELDKAMSAGGRTVDIYKAAPIAGRRTCSVRGEWRRSPSARRSRAAGTLYRARIPEDALRLLQKAGLVEIRQTLMNGVQGVEYRFRPEAMDYLSRYFKEIIKGAK